MIKWKYAYDDSHQDKDWLLLHSFVSVFDTLEQAKEAANPFNDWFESTELTDEYTIVIRKHVETITEYFIDNRKSRDYGPFEYGITPYFVIDIHFRFDADAMLFKLTWM